MKNLPQLTEHQGYVTAQQERESIRSTMNTLEVEAHDKAHQAADLKKRIVTIEDLDEVENLEKQAARAAKRAELMLPSLDRAMKAEEFNRGEAAKITIEAAKMEHEQIMSETYDAIATLVSLVVEHRELESTARMQSKAPSQGPGKWSGFGYGPPAPAIAQLAEWARFVRQPR